MASQWMARETKDFLPSLRSEWGDPITMQTCMSATAGFSDLDRITATRKVFRHIASYFFGQRVAYINLLKHAVSLHLSGLLDVRDLDGPRLRDILSKCNFGSPVELPNLSTRPDRPGHIAENLMHDETKTPARQIAKLVGPGVQPIRIPCRRSPVH